VVQWFLDPVTRAKVCPLMYQSGEDGLQQTSYTNHFVGDNWLLTTTAVCRLFPCSSSLSLHFAGIFQYIDPEWVPEDMGGSCTFEPDIDALEDAPALIHSS
jgi:hypothetical protein